ncbi:MAG: hypothetical protein SCALA702_32510 [Melioribacteraceae bacterium]|nr:MAG: hypothetical protein SCALA702_32510 [Melioribacteraceae bacterium]
MTDIYELRKQASSLRKSGDYQAAGKLFQEILQNSVDPNEWDLWGMLFCLNKLKRYNDAYKFGLKYIQKLLDFEMFVSQFIFASFMANIKPYSNKTADKLITYTEEILSAGRNYQDTLFRNKTLLFVIEFFENQGDYESLLNWSEFIDPQNLSAQSEKFEYNGKSVVKNSDREKYYLKVAKAMAKSGNFSKGCNFILEGMKQFPENIWLKWHYAVCVMNKGDHDTGIDLLREVTVVKREWFTLKSLAEAYMQKNKPERALKIAVEACFHSKNIPNPEFRWELYKITGELFLGNGDEELYFKHLSLCCHIREDVGWSLPEEIEAIIDEKGIVFSKDQSTEEELNELAEYWKNYLSENEEVFSGKIKTLLNEGKAGFISSDEGADYYFNSRDFQNEKNKLKPGNPIKFVLKESYDRKKKRLSKIAISPYI